MKPADILTALHHRRVDCATFPARPYGSVMGHYSGPATVSDGENEGVFEVEIHTRPGENRTDFAWHVNIQARLPYDLRFPSGKALSIRLADGRQGVGTLVDPKLIRGVGESPFC